MYVLWVRELVDVLYITQETSLNRYTILIVSVFYVLLTKSTIASMQGNQQ